ncbi:putative cathepsin F [Helianthus annuus]|nr:putative cathepsin F [Helianthus annuus]KAJ0834113.1 putative cathepsin F [Helianthus annuus]
MDPNTCFPILHAIIQIHIFSKKKYLYIFSIKNTTWQNLNGSIITYHLHTTTITNHTNHHNPKYLHHLTTMNHHSFISLLLLFAAVTAIAGDDPLIRQVIPEEEQAAVPLSNVEHHFNQFKTKFGRRYATEEEHDYRMKVFKANLRRAERHQVLDPTAQHGVTKFSDLTPAEFRKKYLGLKKSLKLPADANKAPVLPTNGLPEEFDWREKGAVTPVKNQGSCGSCWSFSTTGALEGSHFLQTGELVSLSEQQLVDCDHECDPAEYNSCDSGCNGGLMNNAFEYILKAGGLQKEEDYPYTGIDGTCHFDKSKIAASVSNFSVVSADEDQIAANLVKYGPLAIGINAAWMQTYIGQVSCPYICSKQNLDHAVLLVGYAAAGYAPLRFKDKPYWIVKNSWGADWGEDGYYKVCSGYNACGMNNMVSAVVATNA